MQSQIGSLNGVSHLSRWFLLLVALALTAALAVPLASAHAQTQPAEDLIDLVPATAYAFLQADLDTSSEQAMLAAELLERAGLDTTLEDQMGMEDIPANTQFAIVVTSIPESTGQVDVGSVAADPMAATESLDDGGYAVIVAGDQATTFVEEELASMQDDSELGYGEISETQHGGVTITVFQSTDEFTDSSAVATVGDYAVFAMRAEDIHPVIVTFNGEIESLEAHEVYQQLMGMLPDAFLSNGWVNGPLLLDAVETASPKTFSMVGDESLAALGAVTAFTFSADQQGFRLETRSIPTEPTAMVPELLDGTFLDTVSSEALFVTNGTNIDSTGLVTMLAFLFASEFAGEDLSATPAADVTLEQSQDEAFSRAESLLGFNIKTDFVDNLTGEFGIAASVSEITSDTPQVDALIVSEVSDPVAVQDVMSKVSFIVGAGMGDQTSVDTREVNGSSVNVIDLSSTGIATEAAFGVINDELVISVGDGLDDYINGPATPLTADENFNQLMANLPSEYTSLTYLNMNQVMQLVSDFSGSMASGMVDADESCGEFATQEEAQAALDEDPFENFLLDQDFDGEACEDYFAPASASPVADADPYANLLGLASVLTEEDGVKSSSSFLLIGGE